MHDHKTDSSSPSLPTDRRALLAGLGGLAAGTFLSAGRAEAGSLTPPGPPSPTGKPLAEVEPRVAVNELNTPTDGFAVHLISQPGSYYLTANIAVGPEKVGVLIDASNVTLDLNGFSIIGASATSSAAGVAVASERTDVLVHNGFIAECRSAVYGEESPGRVMVRNVHVRNTQFEAIFLSNQCIVEDCTIIDGGSISVNEDCRVSRCLVRGGGYHGIGTGSRSVVESCQVSGTTQEGITARDGCLVEGNIVQGCGSGIRVPVGSNTVIRDNIVIYNGHAGLRVDSAGNTVLGNTVRGNGTNYQFVAGNHLELLISQIPQTLSWPCSAKLQGSLTGAAGQSGITIESDDVTVDLAGHALRSAGGAVDGFGVSGQRSRLTIRNGSLQGWEGDGVDLANAFESLCEDLRVAGCGQWGIVSGVLSRVERCRVQSCQSGIRVLDQSSVTGCSVTSCEGEGIALVSNGLAEGNDLRGNEGASIHAIGSGSIVRGNTVRGGFGAGLMASEGGNEFTGNIVNGNSPNYDFIPGNRLDLLISQIPQTLSWPCKATITGTLTGLPNQHGITIESDDVSIDLGGHALVGGGGVEFRAGITTPTGTTRRGISLRNGQIRGWSLWGLYVDTAWGMRIEDVTVVGCNRGFELGDACVVTRCVAEENSQIGFLTGLGGGIFTECSASRNGSSGFALGGSSTVHMCRSTQNGASGFGLVSSGTITHSVAWFNAEDGISGNRVNVMDCDAAHNRIGIRVQGGCASRCHVNSNSVAGIHATNATVQGNTVSGNGSSSSGLEGQGGIWALSGSRIEDNHCRDNKRGIFARDFDGCIIRRNTCDGNETNWDIRAGNAVAPIVVTTNNAAPILGNSYAGDLGSTDPHANFTY